MLGVQLLWLLATHPEARRPALLANVAAAVAFVPWLHGLRADLDSPTTDILSKLAPFNEEQVRLSLAHWALGYPYATIVSLAELPGITAIVLLGLAVILAVAGVAAGRAWQRARPAGDRRVLLIVALALSTPVCEAIFSALGSSSFFGTRNLAASWPALALAFAALLLQPARACE